MCGCMNVICIFLIHVHVHTQQLCFSSFTLAASLFAVFLSSIYSWFGDLALDNVSVNNLVKPRKEGDEGLNVTQSSAE